GVSRYRGKIWSTLSTGKTRSNASPPARNGKQGPRVGSSSEPPGTLAFRGAPTADCPRTAAERRVLENRRDARHASSGSRGHPASTLTRTHRRRGRRAAAAWQATCDLHAREPAAQSEVC